MMSRLLLFINAKNGKSITNTIKMEMKPNFAKRVETVAQHLQNNLKRNERKKKLFRKGKAVFAHGGNERKLLKEITC